MLDMRLKQALLQKGGQDAVSAHAEKYIENLEQFKIPNTVKNNFTFDAFDVLMWFRVLNRINVASPNCSSAHLIGSLIDRTLLSKVGKDLRHTQNVNKKLFLVSRFSFALSDQTINEVNKHVKYAGLAKRFMKLKNYMRVTESDFANAYYMTQTPYAFVQEVNSFTFNTVTVENGVVIRKDTSNQYDDTMEDIINKLSDAEIIPDHPMLKEYNVGLSAKFIFSGVKNPTLFDVRPHINAETRQSTIDKILENK